MNDKLYHAVSLSVPTHRRTAEAPAISPPALGTAACHGSAGKGTIWPRPSGAVSFKLERGAAGSAVCG